MVNYFKIFTLWYTPNKVRLNYCIYPNILLVPNSIEFTGYLSPLLDTQAGPPNDFLAETITVFIFNKLL